MTIWRVKVLDVDKNAKLGTTVYEWFFHNQLDADEYLDDHINNGHLDFTLGSVDGFLGWCSSGGKLFVMCDSCEVN